MIRTIVQLTEEQSKALKEIAKACKVSVAQIIRDSVAVYIATKPPVLTMEEKRHKALQALETIEREGYRDREGKTDVSVNHDQYFAESIL